MIGDHFFREHDMAASNSTDVSLFVLLVATLGPTAGPYSLIVGAAIAGALWPLSGMTNTTRLQGAYFLARIVLTAICISGGAAVLLHNHFDVPLVEGMSIVAFGVGAIGNGWRSIFTSLADGVMAILKGIGSGAGNKSSGRTGRRPYDDGDDSDT